MEIRLLSAFETTFSADNAWALTAESSLLVTLVPPPPAEIRLLTVFESALCSDVRFETVALVTLSALLTMDAAFEAAFATLRALLAAVETIEAALLAALATDSALLAALETVCTFTLSTECA